VTPAELAAAREFRQERRIALASRNAGSPPDITVSPLVRFYRHGCVAKGGRSIALELRERYDFSPEYRDGGQVIPAGRFGFIWIEGKCPVCDVVARSANGRLVDPGDRPPARHAVISRQIGSRT
jgi:hypothetical protein